MPTVELRTQKGHPGPTPYTSRKPNTNVSECGNTPPAECNNNKDRTTEQQNPIKNAASNVTRISTSSKTTGNVNSFVKIL